jgi:S1-C subfamily serine protease
MLPQPMTRAYASGYPLGMFLIISDGIVNYSIAKTLKKNVWACSAPIYPGNSGGGVYDAKTKKLIGITVMVGSHSGPFGSTIVVPYMHMFIPIVYIREFIGLVI